MTAVIELEGVSKWYGDVIGLNDVTAQIGPGVTGLLGPNGAGKSTLLRLVMGLQKPKTGTIRVLGENPWGHPESLSRIGYVPEADAPWKRLPARTAALRLARLAGLTEEAAGPAVDGALERVGLAADASRPIRTFSKGMRQRLKFALALMHEPELLILDEPFIGTDPLTRRDLISLIREHAANGGSVLLSTHVLSDVEALTERILVVDKARLRAAGTVPEIRAWLAQYPRTIRITSSQHRRLGAHLWGWHDVQELTTDGDSITVKTTDAEAFLVHLRDFLVESGMPFEAIENLDDDVEAVFRYLVVGK